ncbi:MAG: hypothetical protein JWQ94_3492 [Tardiphaga sp.]|nr:hypothetical protein [Tardiphaga sp.]
MMNSAPGIDHKAEIDRHFAWFEAKLPARPARFVSWLRQPSSKLVRIPLALLLMLGGIFSILPVLGLWMLPLGMLLIAQDVPFFEKPVAQSLGWIERKWIDRERKKQIEKERLRNIDSAN